MIIPENYKKGRELQKQLSDKVRFCGLPSNGIHLIAGTDVSYSRIGKESTAVAGIVIMEYGTWNVVEEVYAIKDITFPYIPGLLSFRELPVLMEAYEKVQKCPDIWLVDGAGIAHPRRLGLASHFGVTINEPTIGVAKSRLTGTHEEVPLAKGSRVSLYDGAEVIGAVLRSRTNVRPLYISPGHMVSIEQAPEIVLSCCVKYRLPEPTRAAHNYVTSLRQQLFK
jgi:deoxyribonuclease V